MRAGIWKEADALVDRILDYCIARIGQDIGDRTLQRETSLNVLAEPAGPEPTEDYHRGFDDGVRSAITTIQMIKEGDL